MIAMTADAGNPGLLALVSVAHNWSLGAADADLLCFMWPPCRSCQLLARMTWFTGAIAPDRDRKETSRNDFQID